LSLMIAARAAEPSRLRLYAVEVGGDSAGSLDLLIGRKVLPEGPTEFDLVIMNPPFTRSDRVPAVIGGRVRKRLAEAELSFGGVRLADVFEAGLAKPFLVLADLLAKGGGRIVAVLPASVLNRPGWRDVREGMAKGYTVEYLVVDWAGKSFSSDTQIREVLLVLRKGKDLGRPLKVVGLYKGVDELAPEELEAVVDAVRGGCGGIAHGGRFVAHIACVEQGAVELLKDNLYRLVAFKDGELLKWHLGLLTKCNSVKPGDVFEIGSVVDHARGLRVCRRAECRPGLPRAEPALWGSGGALGVRAPAISNAPHVVYAEGNTVVKYWEGRYKANLFMLRRGRLNTQRVLMVSVGEEAVSNVWWPLRPRRADAAEPYLAFFNSAFGFAYLLGERLETDGLYVEYKWGHLEEMSVPDLRGLGVDVELTKDMSKFGDYVRYMGEAQRRMGAPWPDVARHVSQLGNEHSPIARLDLAVYDMLRQTCRGAEPPENIYELLHSEAKTLESNADVTPTI